MLMYFLSPFLLDQILGLYKDIFNGSDSWSCVGFPLVTCFNMKVNHVSNIAIVRDLGDYTMVAIVAKSKYHISSSKPLIQAGKERHGDKKVL